MKVSQSPLDRLPPSPEALKQLERLHATLLQREVTTKQRDPVEFVLVTPVPLPHWTPAPVT